MSPFMLAALFGSGAWLLSRGPRGRDSTHLEPGNYRLEEGVVVGLELPKRVYAWEGPEFITVRPLDDSGLRYGVRLEKVPMNVDDVQRLRFFANRSDGKLAYDFEYDFLVR